MTRRSCFAATVSTASISQARPPKWTTRMAAVWSVMGGFEPGGIDVVGVLVDVDEDGGEAGAEDAGGGGHVGVGGDEDFGAAGQMQAHEGQFEGDAAAVDTEAVGRTLVGGEGLFEFVDLVGAQTPPGTAANDFGDGLDVGLLDDGPLGEGFGADGLAAEEREVTHGSFCFQAPAKR